MAASRDAWCALGIPERPAPARPTARDEITLPLRGRPLRDRFVLRVIKALGLAVNIVILAYLMVVHRLAGLRRPPDPGRR